MAEKEKKKEINYYKYATFALVGIILLFGIFYIYNNYQLVKYQAYYEAGKSDMISQIMKEINAQGAVVIYNNEGNMSIFGQNYINYNQQEVLWNIINFVAENGYIVFEDEEGNSLVLVPYVEEEMSPSMGLGEFQLY